MADKVLRFAVKGVGSGVGLVSESIHHYKDKRRSKSQQISETGDAAEGSSLSVNSSLEQAKPEQDDIPPPYQENDEEQWQLDEAQDELTNKNPELLPDEQKQVASPKEIKQSESQNPNNPKVVFEKFIERHPIPNLPAGTKLSLPVIVPQRRPKDRSRGFIRAYAPVLEEVGIDQAAFIDFLDTFQQASRASPAIQVLNLAGLIIGSIPHIYGVAISTALQVAVYILEEIQGRKRTNRFLDRVNEGYFRPRGLYALVMTWRPESARDDSNSTEIDLNSTITSSMRGNSSNPISRVQRIMKKSDGTTYGDDAYENFGFSEVAPLVFPALDKAVSAEPPKTVTEKLKRAQGFVADYYDRRAMAAYTANNPNSMLTTAVGFERQPQFKSRYADPNHPASSGNLISLLSGGKFNPPRLGQGLGDPNQQHWGIGWVANKIVIARNEHKAKKNAALQEKDQSTTNQDDQQSQIPAPEQEQKPVDTTTSAQNEATPAPEMEGPEKQELTQRQIYQLRAMAGLYPDGRAGKGIPGAPKGITRIIQRDVLYLMIVNMPTEEEMAAAATAIKDADKVVSAAEAAIPIDPSETIEKEEGSATMPEERESGVGKTNSGE